MTTRRSRFLLLRAEGSIKEKRFDGDPNEVRGRGEKTKSFRAKEGMGTMGSQYIRGTTDLKQIRIRNKNHTKYLTNKK